MVSLQAGKIGAVNKNISGINGPGRLSGIGEIQEACMQQYTGGSQEIG
jgi:hypothetical protein